MSTTKGITARVAHFCSYCQMHASDDAVPVIQPGHRYLRHVGFPGEEGVNGARPLVVRECISCGTDRDDYAPTQFGACGTYCHGTRPCSLPYQFIGEKQHDHSCQVCCVVDADLLPAATAPSLTEGGPQ